MIINLTQHTATTDQVIAGVEEFAPEAKKQLIELLTFKRLTTKAEIDSRCEQIVGLIPSQYKKAMVGCALWMVAPLESALLSKGIEPVYAFSERDSVEVVNSDGSVTKTNVFKHVGFF